MNQILRNVNRKKNESKRLEHRISTNIARLKDIIRQESQSVPLQYMRPETSKSRHEGSGGSLDLNNRENDANDDMNGNACRNLGNTWAVFNKVEHNPTDAIRKVLSNTRGNPRQSLYNRNHIQNEDISLDQTDGTIFAKEKQSFRGSLRKEFIPKIYKFNGRPVNLYMHIERDIIFKNEYSDDKMTPRDMHSKDRSEKSGRTHKLKHQLMSKSQDPSYDLVLKAELPQTHSTGFSKARKAQSTRQGSVNKAMVSTFGGRTATGTYTNFRDLRKKYDKIQKPRAQRHGLDLTTISVFPSVEAVITPQAQKQRSDIHEKRERDLAWKQKIDLYSFFDQDFIYDIDRILHPDKYGELVTRGNNLKRTIQKEMEQKYKFEPWLVNWNYREKNKSKSLKGSKDNIKSLKLSSDDISTQTNKIKYTSSPTKKISQNKQFLTEKLMRNRRVIKQVIEAIKIRALLDRKLVSQDDREVFAPEPYFISGTKQLFLHVKADRILKLQSFLLKNPNYVYQYDSNGRSILHLAVIDKAIRCFDHILQHKPVISKRDLLGLTALDYALIENNSYYVRLLLAAGAYPFVKVISNKKLRCKVYSNNTFLVEQAMFVWLKGYFTPGNLVTRCLAYCQSMKAILDGMEAY